MRIKALVVRILRQFLRDRRTLALLIFAPIFILTMLWLVFDQGEIDPTIGVVPVMEPFIEEDNETFILYDSEKEVEELLQEREIDAYLLMNPIPVLKLEGSDPSVNRAVIQEVQEWLKTLQPKKDELSLDVQFLHGSADMKQFDYFGPVLLGFFVFFFVFLISGVSFLRERTSGTLERLLASPLKAWEIVIGYVLGFGIFTVLQASLISWYAIYVLDMMMEGAFWQVLLVILLLSFTALTIGILLSAFAKNELQMVQFIPLVVVPQIFFSGLFNIETIHPTLQWIGPCTPLYYAANSLRDVMIRGYSLWDTSIHLMVLAGFSFLFILLNIAALKKYRKI
ncbi:MAG: ABC transporter permease [Bacillus sp. (in: Bacteria)]|nr:ABC transporter permease [Bacillus sp. (in: firmicutes)]